VWHRIHRLPLRNGEGGGLHTLALVSVTIGGPESELRLSG
jgi:hypothetical protein